MDKFFLSEKREQLGSVIEIKLPKKYKSLFSFCFDEVDRIEKLYSRFLDSSELSMVNSNLDKWVGVGDEFIDLVDAGLSFGKDTSGNFDMTLKENLDFLGYDKDYSFVLKDFDFKKSFFPVRIDKKRGRVFLKKEIDFGGHGKGYAIDRVAKILDEKGVESYYINAGGDIFAKGDDWVILLENPDDFEVAIGKVVLNGKSIACSSSNRRRWKGAHHLLNSRTGLPQNSVKAIFVLADSAMEADAYATALFTSGFDSAIRLSKKLSVEVLVISSENKFYQSPSFEVEFF